MKIIALFVFAYLALIIFGLAVFHEANERGRARKWDQEDE